MDLEVDSTKLANKHNWTTDEKALYINDGTTAYGLTDNNNYFYMVRFKVFREGTKLKVIIFFVLIPILIVFSDCCSLRPSNLFIQQHICSVVLLISAIHSVTWMG